MAKRQRFQLQIGGFDNLIEKLDELQGDVKNVLIDALEQAGETIGEDTYDVMVNKNLYPAKGKYSKGDTLESLVKHPKPIWYGSGAEINVGFDKTKPGHGGYLITGTPKMQPIWKLEDIYARKKYAKRINSDIAELINEAIIEKMEE